MLRILYSVCVFFVIVNSQPLTSLGWQQPTLSLTSAQPCGSCHAITLFMMTYKISQFTKIKLVNTSGKLFSNRLQWRKSTEVRNVRWWEKHRWLSRWTIYWKLEFIKTEICRWYHTQNYNKHLLTSLTEWTRNMVIDDQRRQNRTYGNIR